MRNVPSLKRALRLLLCALVILLPSCTGTMNPNSDRKFGTATGPHGNGAGYGAVSDLEPLCALDSTQGDLLRISCKVVAHADKGQVPVLVLPNGVTIEWKVPTWLSGAEITVVETRPSVDSLTFEALLRVAQGTTSQVRFEFLATPKEGVAETHSQIITLPYSVETYGQITTLENFFQSGAGVGPTGGFGLMKREILLTEMSLPLTVRQAHPICRMRGHIYVASSSGVYKRQDGRYRLFAGKLYGRQTGRQIVDATKRAIGFYPALVCQEGKTVDEDRVYVVGAPSRVHTPGPFWVSRLKTDRSGEFFVSPASMQVRDISGAAMGRDGVLYLYTADDDTPRILSFSKDGKFSVVTTLKLPPGMAFAPPRPSVWDGIFAGDLALAPNGDFWVTLTRANAVLEVKRDGTTRILAGAAHLDAPLGIAVHPSGDLLVADHYHNRIARLTPSTGAVSTYMGGVTPPPLLGLTSDTPSILAPKKPVGLFLQGRSLTMSYEPAENDISGHLGYVELTAEGAPVKWTTLIGGQLRLLPAGRLIKDAASVARSANATSPGFFLGALGVNEYRRDGSLCYLERIPNRLSCLVPDVNGNLLTQEIVGYPAVPQVNRTLTPVASRASGITNLNGFTPGKDGAYYLAQSWPPLIHKVTWNQTAGRFERVTIAGSGRRGNALSAADALDADLLHPTAITYHADGSLYFSDWIDGGDARIKRLIPEGGKYRLETVAGNGVVGPIEVGASALNSPLTWVLDLKFNARGELLVSQHCTGTCGGLFRLTATGVWERLAGGGTVAATEGEALKLPLRARNFSFGTGDDIYVVDGALAVKRLFRPRPGEPYRMETVVDIDLDSPGCTGGAVSSNVSASEIESTWRASLNSVCIGNVWGIAVRDRCDTTGELELSLTENFADDSIQSLLVIAKRACR